MPSHDPRVHDSTARSTQATSGVWLAIGAYGLWGILPGYFLALAPAGASEIVAFRVLWSLVFCSLLLTVLRAWPALLGSFRRRRVRWGFLVSGLLIYGNWQIYVFATTSGHVVEGSLGYFINPIVTIVLGVVFLRERLRMLQWVAVGVSFLAVVVLSVDYGRLPWISLGLAFSFGVYGLVKKTIGADVDAVTGLTLETAWISPIAIVVLLVLSATGAGVSFGNAGVGHALLLASSGVITAIPLLLFAGAARRVPLSTLGLTQYLAPILQLLFGVVVMHEPMPTVRWVGFALVWVALVLITVDVLVRQRYRALRRQAGA